MGLVEAAVEAGLLGDTFEGAVDITGPEFGIIFSFFDGKFPFEFRVLVFKSLVEYFGLFFFEIELSYDFFKVGDLFFVQGKFVFEIVDLNGQFLFFLLEHLLLLPHRPLKLVELVLVQVYYLLLIFKVVLQQLCLLEQLFFRLLLVVQVALELLQFL